MPQKRGNKCYFCFKYQQPKKLEDHIRQVHTKERPLPCIKCFKTFAAAKHVRLHYEEVHPKHGPQKCPLNSSVHTQIQNIYTCNKCNKNFSTQQGLNRHLVIHDPARKRSFICTICRKGFYDRSTLRLHLKKHKYGPKIILFCYFCAKRYGSQCTLYQHLPKHTGEKVDLKNCSFCPKVYNSLTKLNAHIRSIHTLERDYACTKCDKRFRMKSELKSHLSQVHSNDRPVKCPQCPATFKVKMVMNTHFLILHKGVKNRTCDQCGKRFFGTSDLKRHIAVHHTVRMKTIPCPICNKMFDCNAYMRSHLKSHSEYKYGCYFCKRRFKEMRTYRNHLSVHTMEKLFRCKCNITNLKTGTAKRCRYEGNSSVNLKMHTKVEHEGYRFQCSFCPMELKSQNFLNNHIASLHTLERPYNCEDCDKNYISQANLSRHRRRQHVKRS